MKTATAKEIKNELADLEREQLLQLLQRLSRFKKENKELLSYLLFASVDEDAYISTVKKDIDEDFSKINTSSAYYIKKSLRKILRHIKKYSRYSGKKETETDLLIHFLRKMNSLPSSSRKNHVLQKIYERQVNIINKNLDMLHEDLQHDFRAQMLDL